MILASKMCSPNLAEWRRQERAEIPLLHIYSPSSGLTFICKCSFISADENTSALRLQNHKKMCLNFKMEISHGILITVDNTHADVISVDSIWRGGSVGTLHTYHTHHLERAKHPEAHPWPILQRDWIQYWQQNCRGEPPYTDIKEKKIKLWNYRDLDKSRSWSPCGCNHPLLHQVWFTLSGVHTLI